MKARIDIPAERERIQKRLAVVTRPLLQAWADGIGTVKLREREDAAKDEIRSLKRRLSALKQLEKKRKAA